MIILIKPLKHFSTSFEFFSFLERINNNNNSAKKFKLEKETRSPVFVHL